MNLNRESYEQIINDILSLEGGVGALDTESYHWNLNTFKSNFLLSSFRTDDRIFELIKNKLTGFFNFFNIQVQDMVQNQNGRVSIDIKKLDRALSSLNVNLVVHDNLSTQEKYLMDKIQDAQNKIILTNQRMDLIKREKATKRHQNINEMRGLHKFISFSEPRSHISNPYTRKTKKSPSRST